MGASAEDFRIRRGPSRRKDLRRMAEVGQTQKIMIPIAVKCMGSSGWARRLLYVSIHVSMRVYIYIPHI